MSDKSSCYADFGPAKFPRVPGDAPEHMVPPFLINGAKPHTLKQALGLSPGGVNYVEEAAVEMVLPTDAKARKNIPICTGVLDYFPRALAEVARVSKAGNDQHNPGMPLHWDKTKSMDHADCIPRHLIDRFARDDDGQRHAAKLAWRALAFLEILLEQETLS